MTTSALLRLRISLAAAPLRCEWALVAVGQPTLTGTDLLASLPRGAARVQVVIAAADVLFTSRMLPAAARRDPALLAYAVEDVTARDPESIQVHWLGKLAGESGADALAVLDKPALRLWTAALAAAGITGFEMICETLLLPLHPGEWSLAWNGEEGFVRTGVVDGACTDCGDRDNPPLSLQMLLRAATLAQTCPTALVVYPAHANAQPDVAAWSRSLGLPVTSAANWHWHAVAADEGPVLAQARQRWQLFAGLLPRLRPALWLLGLALSMHAVALGLSWNSLAATQQELRAGMESHFRSLFPDAVAVVDPVLQLRRQVTTARRAAGEPDSSDFLPMLEAVALALADMGNPQLTQSPLPSSALRSVEYSSGRLMLEFSVVPAAGLQQLQQRLRSAGFVADTAPATADGGNPNPVLIVRAE